MTSSSNIVNMCSTQCHIIFVTVHAAIASVEINLVGAWGHESIIWCHTLLMVYTRLRLCLYRTVNVRGGHH